MAACYYEDYFDVFMGRNAISVKEALYWMPLPDYNSKSS